MLCLRTDRNHFFAGEQMKIETWICNDLNFITKGCVLRYQLEKDNKVLIANEIFPDIPVNSTKFQGFINFKAPQVKTRTSYVLRSALFDVNNTGISQSILNLDIFPQIKPVHADVYCIGSLSKSIISDLNLHRADDPALAQTIMVDDFAWYQKNRSKVNQLVSSGKTLVFLELAKGSYDIANTKIKVVNTSMGSYYFASPATAHDLVKWAKPMDFKCWYDQSKGYITPFLNAVFQADHWDAVLTSGNSNWINDEGQTMAAAELKYGKGCFRICQVHLAHRSRTNPVARKFILKLISSK
jgi:hypothetical protein